MTTLWNSPVKRDDGRAAADALAAHRHVRAGVVGHIDVHGVGVVDVVGGARREREGEPGRLRAVERVADAFVVGRHAKHAGDERLVGAVTVVGLGEASVEFEIGGDGRARQQAPAHERDAQRAGRMAARRADHDGADDVADADDLHVRLLSAPEARLNA